MMREFGSFKDLLGYVDSQIANYRKVFGELIRVVEDMRARAERQKRILEAIAKLSPGTQVSGEEGSYQVDLRGVKVLVNPSPVRELEVLEKVLEEINNKITRLANLRKDLEVLGALEGGKVVAYIKDDVPEIILLKI
jgi:hypothetical protein